MTLAMETNYCCPGELHSISRAVHLGRMGAFYEGCRTCPHRDDAEGLPLRLRQRLAEAARRPPQSILQSDGLAGLYGDAIDASLVRRFTSAFGIWLRERAEQQIAPTVLLAGDDRSLTADLVAAAGDGLRYVSCNVVDLGGSTAACLAHAIDTTGATAGVLIGNAPSQLRSVSLSLWTECGQPVSGCELGEPLEAIWTMANQPVVRPGRSYGGWQRDDCQQRYLDRLAPYFHALRPLEFLLDTPCLPLKRLLNRLLSRVSCRFVTPSEVDSRRLNRLHFRIWIDGDGECLKVFDEQGRPVVSELLLRMLAQRLCSKRSSAQIVAEESTSTATAARLREFGLKVIGSAASRAQMHAAMVESQAALGGGPSGRIWFPGPTPAADALEALSQLLEILSLSDRPLSQVLADSRVAQVE